MNDRQSPAECQNRDIDWPSIRRRLEEAGAALANGHGAGGDNADAILKARAVALAKRPVSEEVDGEQVHVLEFSLSGETYAIETSYLKETLGLAQFTPLFCTPPFVAGILNVRGRIVSLVDLRRFFELPAGGLSNLDRVIIVGDGSMEFGILADSITGTGSIPVHALQSTLPTLTGIRQEFLRGVTGDRLVLLDMGKILADARLVVHEEVE
jgi:purine-binding chemotaxis protein CheW